MSLPRPDRMLTWLFVGMFFLAVGVYFFHDIHINPQIDSQGLWNASDLLMAMQEGEWLSWFLAVRKYPLFYVLHFAVPLRFAGLPYDIIAPVGFFLIGRTITLAYAIGILLLLWWHSRSRGEGPSAVLLLMTSLLFLMFTSAIRPHIPVAFWTFLTYLLSLRLRERRTAGNVVLSFGSALLAFCTLQSGLFAFIFPLWASCRTWRPRELLRAAGILVGTLLLAIPLGYPFLLARFFGVATEVGVDLGHGVGLDFALPQGWRMLLLLLGSGPFILLFAAWWCVRLARRREPWDPSLLPVVVYVLLFTAVFAFHTITNSRFFLPVLPFVCILGARAFSAAPAWLRRGILLLLIVIFARFAWLAIRPNTYQQAYSALIQYEGLILTLSQPHYFFEFLGQNFVGKEKAGDATFMIATPSERPPEEYSWTPCAQFIASEQTDEIVLLWNDTPWAYYRVFEADAFGPNLFVYCRLAEPS